MNSFAKKVFHALLEILFAPVTIAEAIRFTLLARQRPDENLETYLMRFRSSEFCHDVAIAVFENLQAYPFGDARMFPIRPDDSLEKIYGVCDEDDFEFETDMVLIDTDRDWPRPAEDFEIPHTVEDWVLLISTFPKAEDG